MTHDLLYGSCGLAGWIAFAYKLSHLRGDWHNLALRAICAAFGFSALGFTLNTGVVFRPLDSFIGIPNLTKLLVHGSMLLFSVHVLRLLAFWRYSDARARGRARITLAVGCLAVGAMTTLVLLAPIHSAYTIHFWKSFGGQRYISWHLAIFLASFGIALLMVGRHAWRYANDAGHSPWLRRGLRVTTVGAYTALGYCLCRGVYLSALQVHVRIEFLVDLAIPLVCFGQTLCLIGLTMPSWAPHLTSHKTRRSQLDSYRSLYSLWSALNQTFPAISLYSAAESRDDRDGGNDLDDLLYRRLIEIRDGLLMLRPYLAPQEAGTDMDITTEDSLHRGSAAEAQRIHRALGAMLRGERPGTSIGVIELSGSDTATGELTWLVAVSRAYARLPALDVPPEANPRGEAPTLAP